MRKETNKVAKEKVTIHKVNLTVALFNDGKGNYISFTPALKIFGIGKTESESKEDFDKAVKLFIKIYTKKDILHDKLISLGWRMVDHRVNPPDKFNVPTDILKHGATIENMPMTLKLPVRQYATA